MLATLTLQLKSIDFSDDHLSATTFMVDHDIAADFDFATQLRASVESLPGLALDSGDFVPEGGKVLPPDSTILETVVPNELIESPEIALAAPIESGTAQDLSQASEAIGLETPAMTPIPIVSVLDPIKANVGKIPAALDDVLEAKPLPGEPAAIRAEIAVRTQGLPVNTAEPIATLAPTLMPRNIDGSRNSNSNSNYDLKTPLSQPISNTPILGAKERPESLRLPEMPDLRKGPLSAPSQKMDGTADNATETLRPQIQILQGSQPQAATHNQPNTHAIAAATSALSTNEASFRPMVGQAASPIPTPVRDPSWGDRIGERVLMMAGSQLRTAEIRLTPAELGPLRVQVSVDEGIANVTFHAQHAVTREAIEHAMPRLRELLAENGLGLGQTNVGEEGAAKGNPEQRSGGESSRTSRDSSDVVMTADEQPRQREVLSSNGLVDTFA